MATRIDELIAAYERVVSEPWSTQLAGQERIWFLVYDPAEQRKVDLHFREFEAATVRAGKKWKTISLKPCFPEWLAGHEYRDAYFEDPELIVDQLEAGFIPHAIDHLRREMNALSQDPDTVTALRDVSAIFGFARLSELLQGCSQAFQGRLLIFFPGEFENNHYRLLDARDGWNYLARPITL